MAEYKLCPAIAINKKKNEETVEMVGWKFDAHKFHR